MLVNFCSTLLKTEFVESHRLNILIQHKRCRNFLLAKESIERKRGEIRV